MQLKSLLLLALFGGLLSLSPLSAQQIDILNTNDDPANVVSICQCDTLGLTNGTSPVRYFLSGPFSPVTSFAFELASPNNSWLTADSLDVTELTLSDNTTPADTFSAGTKWAKLAIPCDAPLGPATLRIRNSNGEISDTIYYIINKIPDPAIIDTLIGGAPNPYTTPDDWGFCQGDSVALVVETQLGATYQWLLNGAIFPGETAETLYVKNPGFYSVRVDLGACAVDSKDTLLNFFSITNEIQLASAPPQVFQIDNPSFGNTTPDDSAQFCADQSFLFQGSTPPPASGVTFKYTWLTDSLTQFGDRIYYPTRPGDTLQTMIVDSTIIEDPSEQRFYVVIDDGFCLDTSAVFYVYMDTIPRTRIVKRIYSNGVLGPQIFDNDICMKDSILLRAEQTGTNWEYQWQRLNTSTNLWQNLPNASNPNLDGTLRDLQVDTSIKPIAAISRYRIIVRTLTPQGDAVCTFISDTVRVRWFPEYELDFQPDPWVFNVANVGKDSINFCETDSAVIIAPPTPNQLVSEGLFYQYQWLKDSLDTLGNPIPIPIVGETMRSITVNEGGNYYVIIDDGICIDTSDIYRVFVDTLPRSTIVPRPWPGSPNAPSLNLCLKDSLLLSAADTILPGWEYEWQYDFGIGWGSLPGDTLPWVTVDSSYLPFGGNDTVYFRLRMQYENRFGNTICPFITDSVRVIFFAPPSISFFPDDTVDLCDGDSVLVIAQGNSLSYEWNGGQSLTPQVYLTTPGVNTVVGTGVNGCQTTAFVFVRLFNTQADAGPDIETTSGTPVQLSGSGGVNYRWFADRPIAWSDFLSQNVTVSYTLPDGVKIDTVKIYLQVTNSEGCVDLDSLNLIVRSQEDGDLALVDQAWNLFTPNDDGKNDVWDITEIVQGRGACRLTVLNRWGSTVYEEEPFDGIWEGNDNGSNPLPDGTYYYVLSCEDEVLLKNAVTIIRN
jgi:gliding motility-associated-like protein